MNGFRRVSAPQSNHLPSGRTAAAVFTRSSKPNRTIPVTSNTLPSAQNRSILGESSSLCMRDSDYQPILDIQGEPLHQFLNDVMTFCSKQWNSGPASKASQELA